MEIKTPVSIFISYCHEDEKRKKFRSSLLKHLSLLEKQGNIKIWCDEKIPVGTELSIINEELKKADIVCVLLSVHYICSSSCMDELKSAVALNKRIFPIILSACSWKDLSEIAAIKAVPRDGKPVDSFAHMDDAWQEIYEELKKVVSSMDTKSPKIIENSLEFKKFLSDTGLLSKTCPYKEELSLEDIFVYPDLEETFRDEEKTEKYSSDKLLNLLPSKKRILITGDSQSGRSSLLKILYCQLQQQGFVPIWISAKENDLSGFFERQIEKLYKEQYANSVPFSLVDAKRIVPLIDDFHFYIGTQKKEKIILGLKKYAFSVLTSDDIFVLNFKDTTLEDYSIVHIVPFKPSKKGELIRKWVDLDRNIVEENYRLERIDEATDLVNNTLGREFRNGIMPSYPFFILSVMGAYYTGQPLQDITSQGYCYFFVILMNLGQNGVKGGLVDGYLNFLTHLAFECFTSNKSIMHEEEFSSFVERYRSKYNLPEEINKVKRVLILSNILCHDSTGEYRFKFKYIYYYFVAKYLAENFEREKFLVNNLIAKLHRDDYAYIIIFLTHHIKNISLFEEILLNAWCLLDNKKEASLSKDELAFFNNKLEDMTLNLPSHNITPEETRRQELLLEDKNTEIPAKEHDKEEDDAFSLELRRSIKTIEVIGQVIKNRAGSLDKDSLNSLFEGGLNICFRIISSYFEVLNDKQSEAFFTDLIVKKLKNKSSRDIEEQKKIATKWFWTFNFIFIYAFLNVAITYLGTEQLIPNIIEVANRINTPASLLVKHGMLMQYKQDLDLDEIKNFMEKRNWHYISKNIMKLMVIHHFLIHHIMEKRQQIAALFQISPNRLLVERVKKSDF